MTVRCSSCGAGLRVDPERLAGRTSARCSRCKGTIDLTAALSPTQALEGPAPAVLTCSTCGARLKAPAGPLPERARCPKCRGELRPSSMAASQAATQAIGAPAPAAALRRTEAEDSSSGATRRIDSRALGRQMAAMGSPRESAEVDLDSLVRDAAPQTEPFAPTPRQEEAPDPSPATRLLRPPVEALRGAASDIREAALELGNPRSEPASMPAPAEALTGIKPSASPTATPSIDPSPSRTQPRPRPAAADASPAFPWSRGLLAGLVSGAVIGALWLCLFEGMKGSPVLSFAAPLPALDVIPSLPPIAIRILLPAILGALAGFLAASAGSPTWEQRPLRLTRTLPFAMLVGVAAGLLISFLTTSGELVSLLWPAAHWLRDLVLVGLITPAINQLIPGRRPSSFS